jgi:DNA-binding MarR family transcriptional regulator
MRAVDLAECQACVCFALRRAARAVTRRYDRHLRSSGLRATQFTLLAVLTNAGPQPVQRLAHLLGTERTTLTRNLRTMLARGYVKAEVGSDRRSRTLAVTDEGVKMAGAAFPLWRKAQREIERKIPPAALQELAHSDL